MKLFAFLVILGLVAPSICVSFMSVVMDEFHAYKVRFASRSFMSDPHDMYINLTPVTLVFLCAL